MKLPLARAAAFLLLILAGPAAVVSQDKPSPPPDGQDPPPPPKVNPAEDLAARAKKFREAVTESRGLAFKSDVKVGVYSKEELLKFLRKEMDREMPREEIEAQAKLYRHFGVLPPELDLYQAMLDLFGSAMAGFYHPRSKELRLIELDDEMQLDEQAKLLFREGVTTGDLTLVHELTHAAQDQNFELTTLPLDEKDNDDILAAIKALIEGDATVTSMKWALRDQFYEQVMSMFNDSYKQGQLPGKAGELPAFLRRSMVFGYGYGAEFVQALIKNGNRTWSDVDKSFTEFPLSTEQILHPRKFFGAQRDHPQDVRIKDADALAGEGWKPLYANVHGEFGTYLILNEFKASGDRKEAAAGWDGDRFYSWENAKGGVAVIWYSTWDSDKDAEEFFTAYSQLLKAKVPDAKGEIGDRKASFAWKDGKASIERRGVDVAVVDGAHEALAGRLDDVFKAATKTEIKKMDRYVLNYICPNHPKNRSHKAEKCWDCDAEMKKKE